MIVTTQTTTTHDVVLIGGGIMSATLGTLLQKLEPTWSIALYENLDQAGLESSDPWNNAGTGHAALCELNYAPRQADGTVDPTKALGINEQFWVSRQFWSSLVQDGTLKDPKSFINPLPHMSFVWGDDHADYLQARYEAMSPQPLFETMEHTEDPEQIISMTKHLRDAGFVILMDDFGSGYSSLNMLKDIQIDILKLDMGFLKSSDHSAKGGNILAAIMQMAHSLKMQTIAEGVETKEQVEFLKKIGCQCVQGFYFAKPMPEEKYKELVYA